MTESTTSEALKPVNPTKRTHASYSTNANRKESYVDKEETNDSPSSPSTSKSDNQELSVIEMTRDLMMVRQESTSFSQPSKSGIDWSFGNSDGEDNKSNDEDPADDDDDKSVKDGPIMTQPMTQLSTISDSDTSRLKGDEQEIPEDEERDDKKDAVEQPQERKTDIQPDSTDTTSEEKETSTTGSKEDNEAEDDSDDDDATVALDLNDDEDDAPTQVLSI